MSISWLVPQCRIWGLVSTLNNPITEDNRVQELKTGLVLVDRVEDGSVDGNKDGVQDGDENVDGNGMVVRMGMKTGMGMEMNMGMD